jgi:hypothetical protein
MNNRIDDVEGVLPRFGPEWLRSCGGCEWDACLAAKVDVYSYRAYHPDSKSTKRCERGNYKRSRVLCRFK